MAKHGKNPLAGPLRLGVIYTIAPYLLPRLVKSVRGVMPQTQLILQENFTTRLLEMLRSGELDCALLAEPFPDSGLATAPLYDEPFFAAVPLEHKLAQQDAITPVQLKAETMLLLGSGHCFRDQVLDICPEFARYSSGSVGIQKSFEGSSLETIKYMVAAGLGVTVVLVLERAHARGGQRCEILAVCQRHASAPCGAGVAAQFSALRVPPTAQCDLCL